MLQRLRGPGGRIVDDVLIWEGDEPRRDAADALGRIGDPAAVPELAIALRDEDQLLRMRAVGALGAIPHSDAVRALIPVLGDSSSADVGYVRK
ncbi:MAG TPA: HEAT repeat domain-containing protein [Gemmatimonadetes bacterium]|nr:HEAT repeat domain-containing protein [Gemmatimonadota bacterium]